MKEMARPDWRQPFRYLQSVLGLNCVMATGQYCKLRGKIQDTKTVFRIFQSLILSETEKRVRQPMKRAGTQVGSERHIADPPSRRVLTLRRATMRSFARLTRLSLTKTGRPARTLGIKFHSFFYHMTRTAPRALSLQNY